MNVRGLCRVGAVLFSVMGTPWPAFAQPPAAHNVALIDSMPGDPIGGGTSYTMTPANGGIAAYIEDGFLTVAIRRSDLTLDWYFRFDAPDGASLQPGTYLNARSVWHFGAYPGEKWPRMLGGTSMNNACTTVSGRFVIHQLEMNGQWVSRLALDFEQHCDNIDPALFGVIRYNSTVPASPAFGGSPTYRLDVPVPTHGRVTGAGVDCGNGGSACTATFGAPTTITLTATPDAGYRHGGWTGSCHGAQTTTVRVNTVSTCTAVFVPAVPTTPQTIAVIDSDAGHPYAAQLPRTFTPQGAMFFPRSATANSMIEFEIQWGDGHPWHVLFLTRDGRAIVPGTYETDTAISTSGNYLLVSRGTAECMSATGRVDVHDAAWSGSMVVRAALDLEMRCSVDGPRMVASIRYESPVPTSVIPATPMMPIVVGQAGRPSNGGQMIRHRAREGSYAAASTVRLPWPTYNETMGGELHPALGDVDGDGRNEVVIGLGSSSNGWIAVLDDEANGHQLLRWLRVNWAWYNGVNGAVFPAVGDLDGDGYAEIVAGLGRRSDGWVEIIGGANRGYAHQRWLQVSFSSWRTLNGETHPAVGDLNGDGQAEIVVGLGAGSSGWLEVFHDASEQHRHKQWLQVGWPLFTSSRSGATWPAIGDIDGGSSAPEIVVGLGPGGDGYLQVWSVGTAIQPRDWLRVPWPDYNVQACGETRPAIGKVGTAAPAVAVGLGNCSAVTAGWIAIVETTMTGRPVIWRNGADAEFQRSGSGTFPAVIPR